MPSVKLKRNVVEWWTATLKDGLLVPARGCTRIITFVESDERKEVRESHRVLTANIGDRFLVCGPSIDQIATLHVKSVRVEGWSSYFYVSHGAGAVNDGVVQLMKLKAKAT
jgi:hypothetical protein